jgi:hypothetical protein
LREAEKPGEVAGLLLLKAPEARTAAPGDLTLMVAEAQKFRSQADRAPFLIP